MSTRSNLRTHSTIFLLVLAGILVLVNLLSVRFFGRADLTRDGKFSLSGASIELMESLDDKLVVKAYFTENLPGRFASLERHVRDLLEQYSQHSGGRMQVEFIDPADDEEEQEVARSLGIQKMPNPDIEKDEATIKEGYRGIAFTYGQETETIPAVQSPVGLEYQITSKIKQVVGHRSDIGFLVGHGEPQVEPPDNSDRPLLPQEKMNRGEYRNIRRNLETYNYKDVDLKGGERPVPEEIDALIVVGPTEKLSDKELYRLDQFLLRGGSLAFVVDGVRVEMQQPEMPMLPPTYQTGVSEVGIREMLEHYGATLGRDMVFDKQCSEFVAKCPPVPLPIPRSYPPWPLVTAFEEEHPMTFRLGSLTLPYASPVRVTEEARKDGAREAREIAFSSGNTWVSSASSAVVDPCGIVPSDDLQSGIPLVATLSGEFGSYFAGKDLPIEQPEEEEKEENELSPPDDFVEKSTAPGRLLVVGSSGLPLDDSLVFLSRIDRRQAQNNFTFVQNALDWLTSEEGLIAVRMKTVDDPPLEKVSEGAKAFAKWGNIIGVPLAFILFGLVRWRLRVAGSRKRSAQRKSGEKAA